MFKSNINIEFADVEFKTEFDKGQVLASARIARDLVSVLTGEGHTCSVCILIDDKHAGRRLKISDVAPFLTYVSQHMPRIDYICYESRLTEYKEDMFQCVLPNYRDRVQQKVLGYEDRHGRIACSHDIAIWHLMRLGYIMDDATTLVPVGAFMGRMSLPPFHADRLISVLSETDRTPEQQAQDDILKFCYDDSIASKINRVYFDPVSGEVIH